MNTCIKCKEKYKSDEPDDYYCESCNEERLRIAKELDKQHPTTREHTPNFIQRYDAAKQRSGTPFPRPQDLGIKI